MKTTSYFNKTILFTALVAVVFLAFVIPIFVFAHLNGNEPGHDDQIIWLPYDADPNPADDSVTITVSGRLSAQVDFCTQSSGNIVGVGQQTVPVNTVKVRPNSDLFAGDTIPVSVTPAGGPGPAVPSGCILAGFTEYLYNFNGSKTFDTSSIPDGTYTVRLEITDDFIGYRTLDVGVTIQHAGEPAYCTPNNRNSVPLNTSVPFNLDLTNHPNIQRPVSWSAPTGNPTSAGDVETFNVSFSSTGDHNITVSNSLGSETCQAHVVSGSGYTLNVNSNGASGVGITSSTGHGGTTNYSVGVTSGTAVALTAPATAGSANFSSWTGCDSVSGTGNRTCNLTMPSSNKTVTANYVDSGGGPYTLSVNSTGTTGVVIEGTPSTYGGTTDYSRSEISADTNLSLTAPITSGSFSFSSWSGCDSVSGEGSRTCNVTMSANKTVTAAYVETPGGASGTISADPNPCILGAGETTCATTVTRTVASAEKHQVRIQSSGNVHACKDDGTWETNPSWIRESGHTFVLLDTEGTSCEDTAPILSTLDDVFVWAEGRGTIEVVSNLSTSWTITGPGPEINGSGTSGTYTSQISGSWTIAPASISGFTYTVSPAETQTLSHEGTITFTITYTASGSALEVTPATEGVDIGGTQQFQACFDDEGDGFDCPTTDDYVTTSAEWNSSDTGVATVDNGSNKGLATGVGVGSSDIQATYFGLSDSGVLTVNSGVELACSPSAHEDVYVGQVANFAASGGNGSSYYMWSAPDGTPSSGSGATFDVLYSSTGNKTVTLEDGNQTDQCTVSVINAVCGNGTCEPGGGETCNTCPTDCGACPQPECDDGIDNDGDGTCDTASATCTDGSTPGDPQCTSPNDNSEAIGDPTFEEF